MSNLKLNLSEGLRIGQLTVGQLVLYVQDHPLFLLTPVGYLQQGRLREVVCDCGQMRLVSEASLATGRVKSCGCLRAIIRAKSAEDKVKRLSLKADKKFIQSQIVIEQAKLRALQLQPVHIRDQKAIDECGARLRNLFTRKALLTRQVNKLESRHERK